MSIFNKMKQGVSDVSTKAKNTVEVNRIKGQISKNNSEISINFNSIGKEIFEQYNLKQIQIDSKVESFILHINQLLSKNEEFEREIKAIWNEKECVCGNVVALDSVFCPQCGHKFEISEKPILVQEEQTLDQAFEILDEKDENTISNNYSICSHCDADLEPDSKFCGVCGTEI